MEIETLLVSDTSRYELVFDVQLQSITKTSCSKCTLSLVVGISKRNQMKQKFFVNLHKENIICKQPRENLLQCNGKRPTV
jgi:hypothetical protein